MSLQSKAEFLQHDMDPREARLVAPLQKTGEIIDIPYISEIIPGLYQGAVATHLRLPDEITHVVSLHPWADYRRVHKAQTILKISVQDAEDQAPELFEAAAGWVCQLLHDGGKVLVHCQAGLNRSALVVAIVLTRYLDMSGREAVDLIREKRSPLCLHNPAFEAYALAL